MTFLNILQQQLKEKKRLTRQDVYNLAYQYKHDFDTARRDLEPDKTSFSKPYKENGKIKWWDYINQNEQLKLL